MDLKFLKEIIAKVRGETAKALMDEGVRVGVPVEATNLALPREGHAPSFLSLVFRFPVDKHSVLLRWKDNRERTGASLRAHLLEVYGTDIFSLLPPLEGTLDGCHYRVVGEDDPIHDEMLEQIARNYQLDPVLWCNPSYKPWYTQLESPHEKHPYLAPSVVYIPRFRDLPLQLTLSRPRDTFTSHEELEVYLTSVRRLKEWFATLERIIS